LVGFGRRKDKIKKRVKPRNLDFDCPSCKGRNVFRSRSKTRFEKILRLTRVVGYCRCHSCGWRGRRLAVRKDLIVVVLVVLVSLLVLAVLIRTPA